MRPVSEFFRVPAIILAATALAATPALANDVIFVPGTGDVAVAEAPASADAEARMRAAAERLKDPAFQDGVAAMAEGMTGTMMQLPVGKFFAAIEKARPGTVDREFDEDATLAELAGTDAGELGSEVGEKSRMAMGMMGGFAEAFAAFMPELETLGREMEKNMAGIKASQR